MRFSTVISGITALCAAAAISQARGAEPSVDQLISTSPQQIQSAIQQLPPEVQSRIRQELSTKSPEELMRMSPDDIMAAARSLSPETKAQLKEKWASLSDDQKAQIKSFNPKALLQQLAEKFAAMGPMERKIMTKLLGRAVGTESPEVQ